MKFSCAPLYVLVIAAFVGFTSGDEAGGADLGAQTSAGGDLGAQTSVGGADLGAHTSAGGDLGAQTSAGGADLGAHTSAGGADLGAHTSAGGEQVCDIQLGERIEPDNMPDIILINYVRCLERDTPALRDGVRNANTTQDFRNTMKTYCDNLPTILLCIGLVNTQSERCLNASLSRSLKAIGSDIETAIGVVCEEDGVKAATVIEEVKHLEKRKAIGDTVERCGDEAHALVKDIDNNDSSFVSVAFYNMFRTAKTCMAEAEPVSTVFNDVVDEMFAEMLKKLKCIHPESQAEVLCETFVNN